MKVDFATRVAIQVASNPEEAQRKPSVALVFPQEPPVLVRP
ncbi:unnamed protein product [Acidithrix sp. C25]|nr:unnamed protein product [Acidithrix sp. C25]